MNWDAVILTCRNSHNKEAYQKELKRMQAEGIFPAQSLVTCVTDPEDNVGSGGATINALLHSAEYLSAKKGYTVLDQDALKGKRIIIFHDGRQVPFEPIGKTFITLPNILTEQQFSPKDASYNLEKLFNTVSEKLAKDSPSGVWIVSTDMVFNVHHIFDWSRLDSESVVAFSVPVAMDVARKIGVYHIQNEFAQKIVYQGSVQEIDSCIVPDYGHPAVCGLLFFSTPVAEGVLSLHVIPPLDGSTYLGIDNGATPVQMSLFFDLLACMCPAWKEESCRVAVQRQNSETVVKGRTTSENQGHSIYSAARKTTMERRVRNVLFEKLSQYRVRVVLLDGSVEYPNLPGTSFTSCLRNQSDNGGMLKGDETTQHNKTISLNSCYPTCSVVLNDTVLRNCHLDDSISTTMDGCIISNIDQWTSKIFLDKQNFANICMTQFPLRLPCNFFVLATWGVNDVSKSDLFGTPMETFMKERSILKEDLWNDDECKTLMSARLFPIYSQSENVNELARISEVYMWLRSRSDDFDNFLVNNWRIMRRVSFTDIFETIDTAAVFKHQRNLFFTRGKKLLRTILTSNVEQSARFLFKCCVLEGRQFDLLTYLDDLLPELQNSPGHAARLFATISDLLGTMACQEGGLRSGPAANRNWTTSYALIRNNRLVEASQLMQQLRCDWLSQPNLLIRCARHYEGAAQLLISQAVSTALVSIEPSLLAAPNASRSCEKPAGVLVECPARVDLAGGWSDTPPLCYESGGLVVTLAVKVDGRRPIGCCIVVTESPVINIYQEDEVFTINNLENMFDFDKPNIPGALVKASLVFVTGLEAGKKTLFTDFLYSEFSGGLDIKTWSHLPRGSGLGTSSILAAAVLTALWKIQGKSPTENDIIHGVLIIEQFMTTGGGWQDQVGGVYPGVKIGCSSPQLPLKVTVETLQLANINLLEKRLFLVYTGITRLAKNLLQEVIRNWYAKTTEIVNTTKNLVDNAKKCRSLLLSDDLNMLGECLDTYWSQKKTMATGCEPEFVGILISRLRSECLGLSLTGAGGGGFLVGVLKDTVDSRTKAIQIVQQFNLEFFSGIKVCCLEIDQEGITIEKFIDPTDAKNKYEAV